MAALRSALSLLRFNPNFAIVLKDGVTKIDSGK